MSANPPTKLFRLIIRSATDLVVFDEFVVGAHRAARIARRFTQGRVFRKSQWSGVVGMRGKGGTASLIEVAPHRNTVIKATA